MYGVILINFWLECFSLNKGHMYSCNNKRYIFLKRQMFHVPNMKRQHIVILD